MSRPRFLVRLLAVADRVNLPLLASALTFDALMAMIPLAILVVAGLGYLLEQTSYFGTSDPGALVGAFLPVHLHRDGTPDPFALVESILASVRSYRSKLTLVAIPAFVWFGSRVFASIRVCLSQIFQVRGPQRHPSLVLDYLIGYGFGKLRDVVMLGVMLVLALANTVLSAGVAVLTAEGVVVPRGLGFFTTGLGVVLTEVVAIGSALALFLLLYRYASPRVLPWRTALVAAAVTTVGFELAKRLYGLYLGFLAGGGALSVDANIGAVLLFILWVWYMALVFLIGAAVSEGWHAGK